MFLSSCSGTFPGYPGKCLDQHAAPSPTLQSPDTLHSHCVHPNGLTFSKEAKNQGGKTQQKKENRFLRLAIGGSALQTPDPTPCHILEDVVCLPPSSPFPESL